MSWPLLAGSARNRVSCQSPMPSKTKPPSQTTPPMAVIGPAAADVVMLAGSGRQATHRISSCGRYTVRSAYQFLFPGARSSSSR